MKTLKIVTFISKLNETNMYILQDRERDRAVLIDPSNAEAASKHLKDNWLTLDYIILTHEHYDHISALNDLQEAFPDAKVIASAVCSDRIQNPKQNLSKLFNIILDFKRNNEPERDIYVCDVKPYEAKGADITFEREYELRWGGHKFVLYEAPGHSKGSTLIVVDDKILFSGDTISYDYELITGFPGGSKKEYENVTEPLLGSFDRNVKVYPGHGRACFLKEILQI